MKSCTNSPSSLNRCQCTPSLQFSNSLYTQAEKLNSADNNKLSLVNVCTDKEYRYLTNTSMKSKYEQSEIKEKRSVKSKRVLVESIMDNVQYETISSRKKCQELVNTLNGGKCDGLENSENEFPNNRGQRKNGKSKKVKDKSKINIPQKCDNEKSKSGEIIKQALKKQNLVHSDTEINFSIGKETHTLKNNIREALKALENTPLRKSTRLQRKLNNDENKTKHSKTTVFNSNTNRYEKCENSDVQSVSEGKHNERKCKLLHSDMPTKGNCRKFMFNIMSPIKENISESSSGLTHTPRGLQNHMPLYKSENINCNITEDIYDFKYDENEEPCIKKKRKKRTNNKKPKLCSQNLTINRIKFGSMSSLNSTKSKFGSTSSINSAHSDYEKKTKVQNKEKATFPVHESKDFNDICTSKKKMVQTCESIPKSDSNVTSINNSNKIFYCSPVHSQTSLTMKSSQKHVAHTPSYNVNSMIDHSNIYSVGNESHNLGELDCSKLQIADCCSENNLYYNNSVHQFHCSNVHNASPVSTEGINFSTPCKKRCDRAFNSSIFDKHGSFNSLVLGDKRCGEEGFASEEYDESNFFGFDVNESIEEPLLSSIKKSICAKKATIPIISCKREIFPENNVNIQNIIQVLQSEVNHKHKNKSETRNTENSENSEDDSKSVYCRKSPRRSYERIRHYWDQVDTDEERTVEEEVEDVFEIETKKHHRKKAKTHAEEEAEELAAKLNCQFQEIDKFNLCVE